MHMHACLHIYTRVIKKVSCLFRIGIFIDSTHMKL